MKTIAFYLPQFHAIPENDEWWGKGFTEWVNVKKAESLYEGHYQPRIPLGENYYNLLDIDVMKWQVSLAKEYGLYGFCFYHYWFGGHKLLEKPVDAFLEHTEIDFPFCLCWANEAWTNAWVSSKNKVLIEQNYGSEQEWKEHFDYLLPFFKDKRYICVDGKPLVVIYRPELIECLNDMLDYWQRLAKENELEGLTFAYQQVFFAEQKHKDDSRFAYQIEYQPSYAWRDMEKGGYKVLSAFKKKIITGLENRWSKLSDEGQKTWWGKAFESVLDRVRDIHPQGLTIQNYNDVWKTVLARKPTNEKSVPGAFVDWDNTPRRRQTGRVFEGASPEKFEKYMTLQIRRAKEVYHKDMLFLFAWNEWAEGGYMEPDEKYGHAYLEALRNALKANGEA